MGNHVRALVILFLLEVTACDSGFKSVTVDSFKNEVVGDFYEFSYTSSDGQSRSEKGVKTRLGDAEFYEVTGTYSFQAPDGKFYFFEYSSGVDGFKAVVKENEPISIGQHLDVNLIKSLVG